MPVMVGQVYTSSIDVTDKAQQPVTPASATLMISQVGTTFQQQVNITPTTPHVSYDFTMPNEGLWRFEWQTQTPGAPQLDYVTCRAFLSVISLDEAREYVGCQDKRRDRPLQLLMAAATRLAEGICGTIVPRTFTDDWIGAAFATAKNVVQVPHGPILDDPNATVAIRSAQSGGPAWATSDLVVNKRHGTCYPRNYIPFWLGPWLATYPAGRLVPSDDLIAGVCEILWDLWGTQRWVNTDSDYPSMTEVASFEQTIGEYHMPGRAAELLEGERYYTFG
jgi:hypothetical protein